jgi:hypothetical protein
VSFSHLSTDIWSISLPSDWVEKGLTEYGGLHFEHSDGSKGMYITTFELGERDVGKSPHEVAESFVSTDVKTLKRMRDYAWRVVADHLTAADGTASIVRDHVAQASCYRVVTKILVRPPIVVRASFHDYSCEEYGVSREYFAPLVESLSLRRVA